MDNPELEKSFEGRAFLQELSNLENCHTESGRIQSYAEDPRAILSHSPAWYVTEALERVSFIPEETYLDLTKISLNLYRTRDGYSHFYLSNIAVNNQELVGLPGSVKTPRREYFGVSWIRNENGDLSYEFKSQHSAEFIQGKEIDVENNYYAINVMAAMFKDNDPRFKKEKVLHNPK